MLRSEVLTERPRHLPFPVTLSYQYTNFTKTRLQLVTCQTFFPIYTKSAIHKISDTGVTVFKFAMFTLSWDNASGKILHTCECTTRNSTHDVHHTCHTQHTRCNTWTRHTSLYFSNSIRILRDSTRCSQYRSDDIQTICHKTTWVTHVLRKCKRLRHLSTTTVTG